MQTASHWKSSQQALSVHSPSRPGSSTCSTSSASAKCRSRSAAIPATGNTIAHTTRAVGTVTRAMAKLKCGDLLGCPRSLRKLLADRGSVGRDVVLIAGGIGLAPLRPVIDHLLGGGARPGVSCCSVARAHRTICSTLASWSTGSEKCEVHVTVDRATGAWRGNIGVVTTLISANAI